MISISGNRRVALILSILFISTQFMIPVTYAGLFTQITSETVLADKQSVSPNPEIYPEFYNQGSGQTDNKMMSTQELSSLFAGEKESTASKENIPSAGKVEKVLVIPIQFTDVQFGPDHNKAYFEGIMNQMKDYYEKNSGYIPASKGMTIDFTVAPVVTSNKTLAYYGGDGTGLGSDDASGHQIYELAREAAILANPSIDFNQFDIDSDPNHIVDHLFIIHAGNGQEDTHSANDIWSHRWSIGGGQLLDGVYAYNYACVPETGTLGVFAHEFGHDIGLPDLYDTDLSKNGYTLGVGDWDTMGTGSWNKMPGDEAGTCPANLSAWSKEFLGWNTVTGITSDGTYTLINSDMNNSAYKFWTNGNVSGDEYYLSEYRRKNGYDAGLPGEGLLIWHVDRKWINTVISGTNSILTSNNVNSYRDRLGVELEQADGKRDMYWYRNGGDANDPFPGATPSMAFTNIPYGMNYYNYDNLKFNYVSVSDFQVSGITATAHYNISERQPAEGPNLYAPANNSIVVTQPKFIWDIVPQSTRYRVQIASDNGFTNILKDIYMTRYAPLLVYENGQYSYTLPDDQKLEYAKTYYWRVAGLNDSSNDANTQWSGTNSFSTWNNWEQKTDMPTARANFTAVEYDDKIYTFGGYVAGLVSTGAAEVYNPQDNSWSVKKSMPVPRQIMTSAVLNNKIYLVGGGTAWVPYDKLFEQYDPAKDEWTTMNEVPSLGGYKSLCVVNGKMYLISRNDYTDYIQEYIPSNDSWITLTSRTADALGEIITASLGGKIYIVSGTGNLSIYDPVTNNWQNTTYRFPISTPSEYKAAVINDELYLLYCGSSYNYFKVYKYNISSNLITEVTTTPAEMLDPGVASVNGKIYMFGGNSSDEFVRKIVFEFSPLLDKPQNINTIKTDQSISLSWDPVTDATGYFISLDEKEIYCASNTYTHQSLLPNSKHKYKVKAVNAKRASLWTDAVEVMTNGAPVIMADPVNFSEGRENGSNIRVNITNGEFRTDGIYNKATVTISPSSLPNGVKQGTVTLINSTSLNITLAGDSTADYDTDIHLTITVDKNEVSTGRYTNPIAQLTLPATIEPQNGLPDPAVAFSFDGQNAGKLINITSSMEYSLDGGNSYVAANSANQILTAAEINSITAENDIKIRLAGDYRVLPGAIQIIDILANTSAPTVTGNDSTNTVTGMLNTMEYCTDGIHWIRYNGSGSLPDLSGNITLKVRYAASGLTMAGVITTISFTASSAVNPPPGGGGLPATNPVIPVVPVVTAPPVTPTSSAITVMTFGDTELGRQIDDPNSRIVTARVTSSAIQDIRLDTAAFKEIVQAGKSLMIDSLKVDITFPAGAVSLPMLTSAGADSKFEVKIEQINPGSAAQKLGDAVKNDGKGLFAIAGCLFEFNTQIVSGNKTQIISGFNAPITVTVTLSGTEPGIADTDKLGVYYYNETSHTWEYMGGAYNAATHGITFTTPHLSLYSVMINEITFSDIKTHWAKADIEKLAAKQITTGVGGGKFNPQGTVTRAEFVSWLVRGLELSKTEGQGTKMKSSVASIPFKDVPGSKWYSDEISLAYRSGIAGDNVSFRPDDRITREEMAYMIAAALKYKGKSANLDEKQTEQQLKDFKDSNRIQAGMRQSVAEAVKLGIITGRPGKMFAPGANATRAEGITMIRRLLSNR